MSAATSVGKYEQLRYPTHLYSGLSTPHHGRITLA
jgi:hypothetical protein